MMKMRTVKLHVFSENIYTGKDLNERYFINKAKKIFKYYLGIPEVFEASCLNGHSFNTVSFDFLFCNSEKTHEINREYRNKDYPADIITFAVFADSRDDEKFILDGEINLGEVIIALDKTAQEADKKNKKFDDELLFLISHGILHLLGFDHQSEEDYNFIIKLQNEALAKL